MTGSLVEHVDPFLWCASVLCFLAAGGAVLLWAIQGQHTATEAARADRAERRSEWHRRESDRLTRSNERLRQLLERQSVEHAERLRDLVAVLDTDTAEPAEARTS